MKKMIKEISITNSTRRKLLFWSTPVITAMTLPAHAETSVCLPAPIMTATVPSKCAGDPPVGQAVFTILSDLALPALEIRSITFTGASATDVFNVPALPANITDAVGLDLEWSGDASDAITCLPLSTVTIEVAYSCNSTALAETMLFDMTTLLTDAIP